MKPQIVFLDAATVDLGDVDVTPLKREGIYTAYKDGSPQQLLTRAKNADVLISNKFVLDDSVFKYLPQLKLVCVSATGVNNVDLKAARARGIAVCNVPGYSTVTVAEHALLFMLALSHRLMVHSDAAVDGTWSRAKTFTILDFPFSDLRGKTLGIVGFGQIGREVKRLAAAFGMKILIADIPGRPKAKGRNPLASVLKKSDFVTLHAPLTRLTHHLIDASRLKFFKKNAALLNLARGGLVDEIAVARALKSGILGAYATDVLHVEPPLKNHPLFDKSIRDKVLMTPHIAWASLESRQNLINEMAANIRAFKKGKKKNRVD